MPVRSFFPPDGVTIAVRLPGCRMVKIRLLFITDEVTQLGPVGRLPWPQLGPKLGKYHSTSRFIDLENNKERIRNSDSFLQNLITSIWREENGGCAAIKVCFAQHNKRGWVPYRNPQGPGQTCVAHVILTA